MSMLRHRAARASDVPAHVLVSVRSPDDRLYAAELESLEPRGGLRIGWTYTRTPPPGWDGWGRRVDAAMLAELGPGPETRPRIYVCGPTSFVETAATLLVEAGHDPDAVPRSGSARLEDEMTERYTDGNELAGLLGEFLVADPHVHTRRRCQSCRREHELAAHRLYRGAGVVLRCPGCGDVALRIAECDDELVLEFRGAYRARRAP